MLFSDADGKISKEAPKVSFLDHGFLFGDSLYEVVRVYGKKILTWNEHMRRFVKSGERVGIDVEALLPQMKDRAIDVLTKLGEADAALRIIITRGLGKLHIDPRSCVKPALYMVAWKFELAAHSAPARLMIPKIRRNPRTALDPAIKSGNYLNSVLAYKEAVESGYDDALMLNPEGYLTELTTSNVGWLQGDKVFTPHVDTGILHGITRGLLLETTSVEEGSYDLNALRSAEEVFALSTFKEVLPVSELKFENGEIKKYVSHRKTIELQKKLRARIESRLKAEKELF